jgi:sugar phosphate isomerase/epimerase
MIFSLTTRWNAGRHTRGEDMIQEILDLGFDAVELGYDLRADLVPGVLDMVKRSALRVTSLHNFCPVPVGAPHGHPELFTPADPDSRIRESAVIHTTRTIRFAAEVGADVVIIHAGNVSMDQISHQLRVLCEEGRQFTELYEKTKLKLQVQREKKAPKQLEYLARSIEQLLPVCEDSDVKLAIENLPTWESVPTEMEMENLFARFNSPYLAHWHDIGHGRIRENLGFINQERWIERLQPHLVGFHIHDVKPPTHDHLMPGQGQIDFSRFKRFTGPGLINVIEPSPQTPREYVLEGLRNIKQIWNQ